MQHTHDGLFADNISITIRRKKVVRNVSLEVHPGEVVGILGPNGAGKTTCFHLISGLRLSETGTIFLNGHDVTRLPLYRRSHLGLGFLPQERSVFRGMSVEDNIRSIIEIHVTNRMARATQLENILSEFGLLEVRKAQADTLSGGQSRRVEIARCIACNPKIVLLDEPFAGLDPIIMSNFQKIVRYLKDRGLGVLITDHNILETMKLVDRTYILINGEIVIAGTPEEVKQDDFVRESYLGETYV
ncbi:MAG: LPS export ABC transporter ATP-binding protein [Rhodobacteraceae bacterium]|nr:LPS export ABC transporter ATP-binding protein [Paracoccaceae bacterium]